MTLMAVDFLKLHDAASLVPDMASDEWADFLADVRERGITTPLDITRDGVVLDGRHRLRAARELGMRHVPIRFVDTDDETGYMVRAALLRRHLSPSQRAALAARVAPTLPESDAEPTRAAEPDGANLRRPSLEAAARMVGVSPRLVDDAVAVAKHAPDLLPAVRSGSVAVSAAATVARDPEALAAVRDGAATVAEAAAAVRRAHAAKAEPVVVEMTEEQAGPALVQSLRQSQFVRLVPKWAGLIVAMAPETWAPVLSVEERASWAHYLLTAEAWISRWRKAIADPPVFTQIEGGRVS